MIANLALSTVPEEHSGVASGINDTFRQVGIATGVAGLGAVSSRARHIASQTAARHGPHPGRDARPGRQRSRAAGRRPGTRGRGDAGGLSLRAQRGAVARRRVAIAGAALTLLLVRASDIREPDPLPDDAALEPAR